MGCKITFKLVSCQLAIVFFCLVFMNAHAALDAPHNTSTATGCLSCHQMTSTYPKLLPPLDHSAQDIDDTIGNNVCWSCHYGSPGAAYVQTHSSLQTDNGYGDWTVECWVCHNQHLQEQNRYNGSTFGKYIRRSVNLANITGLTKTGSKTVKFTGETGADSFADGEGVVKGICEVCHTQTSHWRNDGTQAGVGVHAGLQGSNCMRCHPHTEGFRADYTCLDCHQDSVNNRAAVGQQFGGNSHHVQTGAPITSDKCYQCHWEADAAGRLTGYHNATAGAAVDLVIYGVGARPESYDIGTTAVAYMADGSRAQILSLNTHCLGCHSDANTSTQPFGDGKTPNQYAWDESTAGAKDGTSIDARYSQTDIDDTTTWGKYSSTTYPNVTPKDKRIKALSAHGNAVNNEGGWDLNETWPNTRNGGTNVACFDCHNSHGSTVEGTTTSYASATTNGGILKETAAGKGGYSVTYKPAAGGAAENKNLHNAAAGLCFDCHMTQDSGTTPWGFQSTFGASQPIMSYWESPYWDGGELAFASQQRSPYKASRGNQGGHFGASSALREGDGTSPINGLCTPCHDPHGVSPKLGANAPYAVPLLKGTFMTSPYKEDAAPAITSIGRIGNGRYGSSGGVFDNASYSQYTIDENTFADWNWDSSSRISENVNQFGGLCLQCHPQSILNPDAGSSSYAWQTMNRVHNTVKGWGGQGANAGNAKHSYTCSKCHTVHNSRLPRLMVTNCLDYSHRNRVTTGGWPAQGSANGSGWQEYGSGSGSGQFPGGGHGTNNPGPDPPDTVTPGSSGFGGVACHEATNANAWPYNQQWNTITNWAGGPPAVISTSPDTTAQGAPQVTVTINGYGFQSGATVSIDDGNIALGAVAFVNPSALTVPVTVGQDATVGAHSVTVTNPDGGAVTGTGVFTVTAGPKPITISPSISQKSQATVTITGTGFQEGATVSCPDAGILVGAATFVDSSTLTVVVTAGVTWVGTHSMTVTNPDGGRGTAQFTITLSPLVTSISPSSRAQGSAQQTVHIYATDYGFGFYNFLNGATVSFNDPDISTGAVSFVSSFELAVTVTVGQGATLGAHDVTVTNPDGGTGTGTGLFAVTAPPVVSSASPGSRAQGSSQTTVTITGTGFQTDATVSFNDPNISVGAATFANSTTLTVPVTVGQGATAGAHNITVNNQDGGSGTGAGLFMVTAGPRPISASPGSIPRNGVQTPVTITGTGFQDGATVSFNDANIGLGAVAFVNSTTLTVPVTVGLAATVGAHAITVNNPDGGSGTGTGLCTVTAPIVTSASPNSRPQGSAQVTVTIAGSGFQNGATVSFNDANITLGTVSFVNSATLTVQVTVGLSATVGAHSVTVQNPDGSTGSANNLFTVTPAPTVTLTSPDSRPQGSAQVTVTITGTGFQSGATVSFNDASITLGTVSFVNSATLTVPVTVGQSATTGAHNVTVTNPDGSTITGNALFSVTAGPHPTSTSPNSMCLSCAHTTVTITGTGFQSGATVSFNDPHVLPESAVTFVNSTTLTVPVAAGYPGATAGPHNVTVTNPDGGSGTGTGIFTVNALPTPTSTSPNKIAQGHQATVTIRGSGFQNGALVAFSGSVLTGPITFVNSTTLTTLVEVMPGAAVGPCDVTVWNPDGGVNIGTGIFTVTANPTITSASPNSIPQGKAWAGSVTVTITGTGFDYFPTVSFNDPNITLASSPQVVNSTTMTVRVRILQEATVGAHTITVTNQDGGSGTGIGVFTVTAGPQPISASPSSICQGAGVVLTITGTGFQNGAAVSSYNGGITFGAVAYQDSTTLTIPITVAQNAGIGPFELIVTNPDGGMAVAILFSITAPPTVTATSPGMINQGSAETTVTITGTGFASGATVSFNDASITTGAVAFVSATTLTVPVTVGASASIGPHDVTVTNPDGGSGTGSGVFTVISELVISAASPDSLALGSPETSVTISGEYFQDGATVSFNDPNITLGPVAFVDPATLTVPVTVGEGAWPGPHDVTVTNPDGESVTGGVFIVISAPDVSSVSPNSLALGSPETTVTIIGNNFDPGSAVSFNDPNITVGPVMFVDPMTLTVPVTVVPGAWLGPHDVTVTNSDGGSGTGFGVFIITPPL